MTHRIAHLRPSDSKTDARPAAVIADAVRTMPHTLRALMRDDESVAELNMLVGFDDYLASEVTRTKNRLRGPLTQIHPALERFLGPRLDHPAVLSLLERYGSSPQLRKAESRHDRTTRQEHLHGTGRAELPWPAPTLPPDRRQRELLQDRLVQPTPHLGP